MSVNRVFWQFLFALFIVFVGFESAYSQNDGYKKTNFGLFGNSLFETPAKSFKKFVDVPSCCSQELKGKAFGFVLGMDVTSPLHISSNLYLRVGPYYKYYSGELSSDEYEDTYNGGINFKHSFKYSISGVGIKPTVIKQIAIGNSDNIGLYFFGDIYYITASHFKQSEDIIGKGSYKDGSTSRNVFEGKIHDLKPLQMALGMGAEAATPITLGENDDVRPIDVFAELELSLTNYSSLAPWRSFFISLGLRYDFLPLSSHPEEPISEPAPQSEPPLPIPIETPREEPSVAEVNAFVPPAAEPAPEPEPTVVPQPAPKLVRKRIIPLLNYVFFEESSISIPERYVTLTPEKAASFLESDVRGGALEIYYNLLNILGKRMQSHPETKIKLTGYNNNMNQEAHNEKLSLARARAVRKYLIESYGIDSARIELEAHNLPKDATRQNELAGLEENRRVEISTKFPELLAPAEFTDSLATDSQDSARSYALVLFEFSSSKLSAEQLNQIEFVKNVFDKNDIVSIEGYSDIMGELNFNERISLDRALGVAKRLGLDRSIVHGVGEGSMLFDNSTPEGRFYCRSVVIKLKPAGSNINLK